MPAVVITAEPFWDELVDRAVSRAAGWGSPTTDLFSGAAGDPAAAEFTRRLLELVLGDDDAVTAAVELKRLAPEAPASMRTPDRLLLRAGGAVSLGLPWAVMPVAKRWLRDRLSHIILASKSQPALVEALRRHTERGVVAVVRPLGDRVFGPTSVAREVNRLVEHASLPSLTHLVVDPARLVPGGSDWSADADVVDAARTLRPVLDAAAAHQTTVLLEPTTVRWARLIPNILELALADSALDRVRVGAAFLAELPESRELYSQVSRWARRRVADGGAPVEAVIGVGGIAATERVEAVRAGLPVPVAEDDVTLTAQFLGLVELALHPGRAVALRPVIASEDALLVAATMGAAEKLGASELYSIRLRAGLAPGLAEKLVREVPEVRVCVPVIHPREYGGAIELLVPLALETAAKSGNAAPDLPDLPDLPAPLAGERVFREAVARAASDPRPSHRTQSRSREWDPTELDSALFYRAPDEPARFDTGGLTAAVLGLTRGETGEVQLTEVTTARAIPVVSETGFANEPDTDASRTENRDWARRLVALAREDVASRDAVGNATAAATDAVTGNDAGAHDTVALSRAELDPDRATHEALAASARWRALSHGQRAIHLRRLALGAVAARDRLLRTLVAETGAPIPHIDAEIGRIVDAARYTGQLAEGLATVRGATFTSDMLALVTGDVWAGLAAQADAALAALGAGSGVLWVAPSGLGESARALLEEWQAAGLPAGSVTLEVLTHQEAVAELAAPRDVDRAIVIGSRSEATALARRRPDLRVEGRFLARGSVIVSPSAELASAVEDVIASAFAGPLLSRANSVIVVGSVGRARRFREALADAVRNLRVGDTSRASDPLRTVGSQGAVTATPATPSTPSKPSTPSTAGAGESVAVEPCPIAIEVGPIPELPNAEQLRALTETDLAERWAVAPEKLDANGRLWRPGVRVDVAAGSSFWNDSRGLPVIGVTQVHTLNEAIRHQNSVGSGAVAGLQATAEGEVAQWLDRAEAATLALNRPTSDVRVERQPVGGWNDAGRGLAPLAAGPNRLVTLGSWQPRPGTPSSTLHLRGLTPEVAALIETMQPELAYAEFDALRRAALADSLTWRTTFAPDRDVAHLGVERNLLRYRPVATQVRLSEGARVAELARVISAALLVRADVTISTGEVLPSALSGFLEQRDIEVSLENDDDWLERVAVSRLGAAERLRLIGGNPVRTAEWLGGRDRVPMWAEPVTMAGPVEILSLVREQAVSARAQRHGVAVPVPGLDSGAKLAGGGGPDTAR